MSKHGPCALRVHPGIHVPATAWWHGPNGHHTTLCTSCLNFWFDNADDDPDLEPAAWGWLIPPEPPAADIAAWARDPRNHGAVAEVLRREARIRPDWLRHFLNREDRARGGGRLVLR
ncbi:hypothetical protein ACGFY9_13940 [Streptomyces sp. NPDC048504]|uniref:hypothetical protein n=1 Tax=Streptomyces sp. NPDC048504 TaxID=3365559 RepID=UPI003712E9E5